MKTFEYIIQDNIGIHARPAGLLVNEAKKYESEITISIGEKSAKATKLMALMALGVKHGQTVIVTIEGADEELAWKGIKAFLEQNL